jgi:hypothetical protein
MKRTNWGYGPDYSSQNYTLRFHRQARITGTWAANVGKQKRIPVSGYICAVLAVLAFWFANFI